MVRRVVERSGRPLSFSLSQRHNKPDAWRDILALTAQAARQGVPIKGQVSPQQVAVLLTLQGSRNSFSDYPSYKAITHKTLAERAAVMRTPEFRTRLLSANLTFFSGRLTRSRQAAGLDERIRLARR
jgi:N-acyl-D-aspartate/D-glutamate deacylase